MKYRNLLIVTAALMGLQSCHQAQEGFEISFDLKNARDSRILVNQDVPEMKSWYIDTLELKDGKAVYRGKVDFPQKLEFSFHGPDGEFYGACGVFADNSRMKVTGDFNRLKQCRASGSSTDSAFVAIGEKGREIFRECNTLAYQAGKAFKDDRRRFDSLTPLLEKARQKVYDYIIGLPGYRTSPVAAYYVFRNFSTSDMDELERALEAFDPSMASNPYVARCRKDLENEKRVMPGQTARDFNLKDMDGKTYSLAGFKGRYVLLEFSASWCGWCKLEIPYLKQLYEKTRGKDFVMLTVNLDDDRTKWEEDVKAHRLPWPVISDLQGFNGPVAKAYNVSGIPMTYLISPDGKILRKGLRREEMITFITELLEKE